MMTGDALFIFVGLVRFTRNWATLLNHVSSINLLMVTHWHSFDFVKYLSFTLSRLRMAKSPPATHERKYYYTHYLLRSDQILLLAYLPFE